MTLRKHKNLQLGLKASILCANYFLLLQVTDRNK
jgi:hypothetical protein